MPSLKIYYGITNGEKYWKGTVNIENEFKNLKEDEFKLFVIRKSKELMKQHYRYSINIFYVHKGDELLICTQHYSIEDSLKDFDIKFR